MKFHDPIILKSLKPSLVNESHLIWTLFSCISSPNDKTQQNKESHLGETTASFGRQRKPTMIRVSIVGTKVQRSFLLPLFSCVSLLNDKVQQNKGCEVPCCRIGKELISSLRWLCLNGTQGLPSPSFLGRLCSSILLEK
jgi:hypothetical protein